ncbi:MAG TPA: hypothetical protein VGC38_03645 [Pseudolabrys sp.]
MALLLPTFILPAPLAHAQTVSDPYTIMAPEPGTQPPKHKTRRGSSNTVYPTPLPAPEKFNPPPSRTVTPLRPANVPPAYVVPQTGQALPNLPMYGSGPGGSETSQDRAVRCSHQAGVYGAAAGDRNAYVGGCINQ